jgi:RimJ/RimL family protein N-acetyltransferase
VILDAGDVVLRPYEAMDREPLLSILGDPEVMKLVLDERPLAREEAEQFVRDHFVDNLRLGFGTLSLKATGEAIGFACYRQCRHLDENDVEFGWVIAKRHHGHGYATAVGEQLIVYALESLRLARILVACNPSNATSEHILREKFKMEFEREVETRPNYRRRVYAASADWRPLKTRP